MSFEAHVLEPIGNDSRDDVVGFYGLPFAATMQNSGDRLQTLADEAGIPLIVSDLNLQHQKQIFGMPAKAANQPNGEIYRSMSLRRAEFLAKQLERYPGVNFIGVGDSLAVPAIQGVALHGEGIFDGVLLRDGWDLDANNHGLLHGIKRYVGYTVRDKAQEMKRHKPLNIPYDHWSQSEPTITDETNIFAKMRNVSDLMSGPENRNNALDLAHKAGQLGLAVNIVTLSHGLSGTLEQQQAFIDSLEAAHQGNGFKAAVAEGWHSDLLDPARAANDIKTAISLMQ